jgi:uncharacterized protein (UPF0335 family)
VLLEALLGYPGTIIFVSHDRAFMEALSRKTLALSAGRPHHLHYGGYADYLESLETLIVSGEGMRGSASVSGGGKPGQSAASSAAAPPGSAVLTSGLRPSIPVCSTTPTPDPGLTRPSFSGEAGGKTSGKTAKTLFCATPTSDPGPPPKTPPGVCSGKDALQGREEAKRRAAAIRRQERAEAALVERIDALETEKKELENRLSAKEVYTSGEKTREVKALLEAATAALDACSREWEQLGSTLRVEPSTQGERTMNGEDGSNFG